MRLASLFAAAAIATLPVMALPGAASAQTVIPVDKFIAVELRGGGAINIKQGPVQRVTLVRGDPKDASFRVHDGTLVISPCDGFCWGSRRLDVEIETPALNGAAIKGGGHIRAEGVFPAQNTVTASI